jgi:DNA-binding beta-propeller fold protein YncE
MKTLLLLATALIAPAVTVATTAAPTYAVTSTIAGPDAGGWDYAKVDPIAHRLYIARSASVTVIDTADGTVIGSIGSITHGHAVVPVSGNRLLVTSGDDASARFLAAGDGRELGRVAVGKKPDAAIVSADGRTGFVMNADGGTVSVISIASMKVTRTIVVKPALEFAALTPAGTLFINNEDANEMEVVDVAHGTAGHAIAMPGCEAPSGLAYDAKSARLIAACANGKAAIVDAGHRRLVGLIDIGMGPDAVILDATRRLAFVPCGKDGVLDILSLDGPSIIRVNRVTTAPGARTGALDQATGAVYLPTASFDPPAKVGGRPIPRPGTFRVLVVRPT